MPPARGALTVLHSTAIPHLRNTTHVRLPNQNAEPTQWDHPVGRKMVGPTGWPPGTPAPHFELRSLEALSRWRSNGVLILSEENGRADRIRTCDLLNPIQAHYQAVLRPAKWAISAIPSLQSSNFGRLQGFLKFRGEGRLPGFSGFRHGRGPDGDSRSRFRWGRSRGGNPWRGVHGVGKGAVRLRDDG